MEITNDAIPENLENLFLNLTARSGEVLQQVNVNAAMAEVTINDNDRESTQHNKSHTVPYVCRLQITEWFFTSQVG